MLRNYQNLFLTAIVCNHLDISNNPMKSSNHLGQSVSMIALLAFASLGIVGLVSLF